MNRLPKVVVLTGAGISAESGLATFRDNNGLWEEHRIEDVATPQAFSADPERVYRFYNARRAQLQDPAITPNTAHLALARLQSTLGDRMMLITQNVDDLHERAGSCGVVHMHGTLQSYRCLRSHKSVAYTSAFDSRTRCSCCNPGSPVRPDIVWFGEMPMHIERIIEALSQADIFIAIGTSGQVYPAAGFVDIARDHSAHTVELNLASASTETLFEETWQGPATSVVPAYVDKLLKAIP
ncbi:NAD-dependent protein deacylase [Salinimonas marina]|uniref:NAD-dependent protein deacylase n=1 Tax=Salinimonas marina TaxID=2785918 RepID=A0A7S9HE98_9ALTE|nr:Sir2 family NAD+-dependent deacetylase [Salinimonas marina]QPG06995.1 NAD-dependent protein deacylase [Salinimonas marina]